MKARWSVHVVVLELKSALVFTRKNTLMYKARQPEFIDCIIFQKSFFPCFYSSALPVFLSVLYQQTEKLPSLGFIPAIFLYLS